MFHKRHMLMGGGIDYNIRRIGLEDSPKALLVCYGNNLYSEIQFVSILHLQFLLDIIGAVFIHIQHHQLPGPDLGDLAAQLGTDGAAAAGNKHRLAPVMPPTAWVVG